MSVTKEEAIKILSGIKGNSFFSEIDESLDLAISALRSITREQVEKMRGEWIDGGCSKCRCTVMYFKGLPTPAYTNFCPWCGSPLTKEAIDLLAKRLEEVLKDG